MTSKTTEWNLSKTDVFWSEIASGKHVVQIYDDEDIFLETLAGFAGSGINAGEAVVIIARPHHINSLEQRLRAHGIYLPALIESGSFIAIDAESLLAKFMVNNRPDKTLFRQSVFAILRKAGQHNRKIRAFGEMVAILWEKELYEATHELENLWNDIMKENNFSLFCAYPHAGFTYDTRGSIKQICDMHSTLIIASQKPLTEILFKKIEKAYN